MSEISHGNATVSTFKNFCGLEEVMKKSPVTLNIRELVSCP